MRKNGILLLFTAFLVTFSSTAQLYNYRFQSYSAGEMDAGTVYEIAEDSQGFIWLGTENGLRRFDSKQFVDFASQTLRGESVYDLRFLGEHDLWIAASNGAFILDLATERVTSVNDRFGASLSDANSIVFVENEAWLGTSNGVVRILMSDSSAQTFTRELEPELLDNEIFDLLVDENGDVYIATARGGLTRYNRSAGKFENFSEGYKNGTLSSNFLRKLFKGTDGKIYIGTESSGLNVFDPRTETFRLMQIEVDNYDPANSSAYSIMQDSRDRFWVGTWANGLLLHDPNSGISRRFIADSNDPNSISGNFVISSFISATGDIWFGTYQSGLFRLGTEENKIIRFTQTKEGLPVSTVRSVYEDSEGYVWIGTGQGGLFRYDYEMDRFTSWLESDGSRDAMARGTIWSMDETDDGSGVWLATSRGIGLLDKASGTISFMEPDESESNSLVGNNVLKVLEHEGVLWAGSWYGGLNKLEIESGRWTYFGHEPENATSLPSNNVNDLLIDSQNRLWVATDEGISRMIEGGFVNYPHTTLMISENKTGEIFICTGESGLLVYREQAGNFEKVRFADRLTSPDVVSMLVDPAGRYWLHSEQGLDIFDPSGEILLHLDRSDGLAGNSNLSRSAAVGPSGKIYFGGREGLSVINPKQLPEALQPQLVLTDFLLLNEPVNVSDTSVLTKNIQFQDSIQLSYLDYIFGVAFTALDFSDESKVSYSYKLEGFDQQWINVQRGDKRATYTNVPQGSYTFRVRAEDPLRRWNPVEKSIFITITPPWWKTLWAKVIFFITGLLVIAGFVYARTARVQRQKKLLEAEVAARTAEIAQQRDEILDQAEKLEALNAQKNQLIGIIAHDIRNPLSSLKSLTDLLDPSILTAENLEDFKGQISQKIDNLSNSIVTLLDWAKAQMDGETMQAESFELRDLVREVAFLYEVSLREKEILLRSAIQKGTTVFADKNQMRAVFRNLIGNAIKFTNAGGSIEVHSKAIADGQLEIEVRDSGVGMEQEKADKIFSSEVSSTKGTQGEQGVGLGLMLVKDFVEKNNGRVWVKSKKGAGTSFFFTLPAG